MTHLTRQLNIIHVSDIHFGQHHVCAPEEADGATAGLVQLGSAIRSDVEELLESRPELAPRPEAPLLVAVTGDLTETAACADTTEFTRAEKFIGELCSGVGAEERRRLFIVPGNHDVVFDEKDCMERRWQPYCSFYNKLFDGVRPTVTDRKARSLTQVHSDLSAGYVIAEINSALYVCRDSADASRGQVDAEAIATLEAQLRDLKNREAESFASAIRIAMVHHHPVLLPSLVEPNRGYDAIVNAHSLLRLLQDFGFHVVLHGHKHYPQTFSYDPDYAWSTKPPASPLVVVAGGSAGSKSLPTGTRSTNSYNLVTIKWHPDARQARVQVLTRGLQRIGDDGALPPHLWSWLDYARSDRLLRTSSSVPTPTSGEILSSTQGDNDATRRKVYETTRGNMPVVEVMPSLIAGQAYEARLWIVPHKRRPSDIPVEVVWNAGPKFRCVRVKGDEDPKFCAAFSYWDSMLVEAQMKFRDGPPASAFVYARIPGDHASVSPPSATPE